MQSRFFSAAQRGELASRRPMRWEQARRSTDDVLPVKSRGRGRCVYPFTLPLRCVEGRGAPLDRWAALQTSSWKHRDVLFLHQIPTDEEPASQSSAPSLDPAGLKQTGGRRDGRVCAACLVPNLVSISPFPKAGSGRSHGLLVARSRGMPMREKFKSDKREKEARTGRQWRETTRGEPEKGKEM